MNRLIIPTWGLWIMFLASVAGSILLAIQLGMIRNG